MDRARLSLATGEGWRPPCPSELVPWHRDVGDVLSLGVGTVSVGDTLGFGSGPGGIGEKANNCEAGR